MRKMQEEMASKSQEGQQATVSRMHDGTGH